MKEIWKDVKKFEGRYQISNLGRVKSLFRIYTRKNGKPCTTKEKILKSSPDKKGYQTVYLATRIKNNKYTIKVHRLVATHFMEIPKSKMEVNHIDGDKNNNELSNLEWMTPSENVKHAFKLGLKSHVGIKHPNALINDDIVRDMRKMLSSGFTQNEVAAHYNVSQPTVSAVKRNKMWSHVI